ncbi:MAG: MarR family winged helix-turn-helix transcriptional regulator [Actinomycetes bacterium]
MVVGREQPVAAGRHDEVANALYSLVASVLRRMPRDISLTTAATLHTLDRQGPQRLTRLAALEGVTQPTMTVLVTRLEHDGLAERRPDPTDGRAVLVVLTAAGRRYVRRRRQAGAASLTGLIAELPAGQATALRGALPAIIGLCALDRSDTAADVKLARVPAGGRR